MVNKTLDMVQTWLTRGALVGISAGVIAFVLSLIVPSVIAAAESAWPGLGAVVGLVIPMLLLLVGLGMVKAQKLKVLDTIPNFVLLLVSVAIVGLLVGLVFPMASGFILNVSEFTIEGLVWALAYISLGVVLLDRAGLKMK